MRNFLAIISLLVLAVSCKKDKANPKDECHGVNCLAYNSNFRFRLVDRQTGQDLLSGPNARYRTWEVGLYADTAHITSFYLRADTVNQTIRLSNTSAREIMFLKVGNGPEYRLDLSFNKLDCCTREVKTIFLDRRLVCNNCTEVIELPVD